MLRLRLITETLMLASFVTGFVGAAFWLGAAQVSMVPRSSLSSGVPDRPQADRLEAIDKTAKEIGYWNSRAALWTAASVTA